jgi:hypothetical protein
VPDYPLEMRHALLASAAADAGRSMGRLHDSFNFLREIKGAEGAFAVFPYMTDRKQPQSTTEYLTPQQVAEELSISTDTVMRRFSKEPGVLDLGTPETCHQRRHRVLRIPRSTLDRVIQESRVA